MSDDHSPFGRPARDAAKRSRRRSAPTPAAPEPPDAGATPDQAQAQRVAETRLGPEARRARANAGADQPAVPRGDAPVLDGNALMAELADLSPADFARLLSQGSPHQPEPGDQVTGIVVRIERDTVFVDIGAKAEGHLERGELDELPRLGDRLVAYVVHSGDRGIQLATRLSGQAAREALLQAKETGIPLQGKVTARNAGGFTVRVGDANAFCPVSQIDRVVAADLDSYVGRTLAFRVLEIRDRDIVVSHRVIAEEEAQVRAEQTWEELAPGQVREGVVTGRRDFGIFVDLDGVRGLVPKRELGWDGEAAPPNQGARVQVRVLEVDREAGRVTLSLKDPALSPWSRLGNDIAIGSVVEGVVTRLESFGAFVRIDAGLEGLVHVSNMAEGRVDHPATVVKVGQKVAVRILGADRERERLELGMKQAGEDWDLEHQAAPTRPEPSRGGLGTMADLFKGIKVKGS